MDIHILQVQSTFADSPSSGWIAKETISQMPGQLDNQKEFILELHLGVFQG